MRNPTTTSSYPMSIQKDLAPPGTYDAICAIAKNILEALRRDAMRVRYFIVPPPVSPVALE